MIKSRKFYWTLIIILFILSVSTFQYYNSGFNVIVKKYRWRGQVEYDDHKANVKFRRDSTDGALFRNNKLKVNDRGIYLDMPGFIIFSPSLFIPWGDVCRCSKETDWGDYRDISLHIKNESVLVELEDKEGKFFKLCEKYSAKNGCAD